MQTAFYLSTDGNFAWEKYNSAYVLTFFIKKLNLKRQESGVQMELRHPTQSNLFVSQTGQAANLITLNAIFIIMLAFIVPINPLLKDE